MLKHRGVWATGIVIGLFVVSGVIFLEPLTRKLIALDSTCSYCHVPQEYLSDVRQAYSKSHPQTMEPDQAQTRCADCHLAPGFINAFYAYSHFLSLTDLFGHSRNRMNERAGAWLPARQAAAYRVRDRLFEYDSSTCRHCHPEEEIEPKRERGKNAHRKALDEKKTCIECHYNEKHQTVDVRENAFAKATDK